MRMRRLFSLASLAVLRIAHQRALSLCLLLGMALAIGMAASIPTFVGMAQTRVLTTELNAQVRTAARAQQSEPLALKFSFLSLGRAVATYDEFVELDHFMTTTVLPRIPLPVRRVVRYVGSDNWAAQPADATRARYPEFDGREFAYLSFATMTDVEPHIRIDEGGLPGPAQSDIVEGLIARDFANKYGLRAGDVLSLTSAETFVTGVDASTTGEGQRFVQVTARVSGIWSPIDPGDEFWIVRPANVNDSLLVRADALKSPVGALRDHFITLVIWSYLLDERALTIENATPLLAFVDGLQQELLDQRGSVDVSQNSLVRALRNYLAASQELITLMLVFSLPIMAVILSFVVLVAGMVVQQQEAELALLRSRGAGGLDVLWMYAVQGLVVAAAALVVGLLASLGVASLAVNTRSFMEWAPPAEWTRPASLPWQSVWFGFAMALICVLMTLPPAVNAARRNVVGYAAARGRVQRNPWWQRAFVDLLLVALCSYVWYQLRGTGGITSGIMLGTGDPLRDPVRFLLPMLMLTGLGLLAGRLMPLAFRLIARGLSPIDALTPVFLAFRDLARAPRSYLAPVLLLIFTLGIAAYGATIGRTLDGHLHDTVYLNNGADVRLIETAESPPVEPVVVGGGSIAPADEGPPALPTLLPVEDHLQLEGVRGVARIARIAARARTLRPASRDDGSTMLAIDRRQFQDVAAPAFRDDYTSGPFNGLVNQLGRSRDAILVEQRFFEQNSLSLGSRLPVEVTVFGQRTFITYTLRGTFTLFPVIAGTETAYDKGFFYVTNLGYTFEQLGRDVSYDALLSTDPGTSAAALARDASMLGFNVLDFRDSRAEIIKQQERPERQGLLGVLSAGFVFMTVLTVIGFAMYSLLSYRRRSVELGVLRALGLSAPQMAVYLGASQAALVIIGTLCGAGVGLLISVMFIPLLQARGSLIASIPPFLVRVAWDSVAALLISMALALAVTVIGSLLFLRRLRVFEAVKLGATV